MKTESSDCNVAINLKNSLFASVAGTKSALISEILSESYGMFITSNNFLSPASSKG